MDSSDDDLADLELSTFNPRNHPSGIDRHADGWYDEKEDNDGSDVSGMCTPHRSWGNGGGASGDDEDLKSFHPSGALTRFGLDSSNGSSIDSPRSHPISSAGSDNNARKSLNPFLESNDDDTLYSRHTTDTSSVDSLSSAHSSSGKNHPLSSFGNNNRTQLSPLNPFLPRASNNPFASSWDEEKDDYDAAIESPFNTEYVYMSRLPEENLGMVLGIDGDQENRKPINSVHVKSITPGGAAARACQGNNRILVGDEIREIDGKALNQLTHDECIKLFQEMPCNVVLTIYRQGEDLESLPVNSPPVPKRRKIVNNNNNETSETSQGSDINLEPTSSEPVPDRKDDSDFTSYHGSDEGDNILVPRNFCVVDVTIVKEENQSLGLSIVPSYGATCDLYQIKRLLPDGACCQSGSLKVGDRLLSCNGQSLKGLGQSQCLYVLKSSGRVVRLTLLRQGQKQGPVTSESHTSSFLPHTDVSVLSASTGQAVSDRQPVLHSNFSSSQHDSKVLSDDDEENLTPSELDTFAEDLAQKEKSSTSLSNEGSRNSDNDIFINSTDAFASPFDVYDSDKGLRSQEKPFGDVSGHYAFAIPPPAQFSDSSEVHNKVDPFECVTNIDDLLSFDNSHLLDGNNQNLTHTQNDEPTEPDAVLISFDDAINPTVQSEQQYNPFALHEDNNPQSLEEFAELCFHNISNQDYLNTDHQFSTPTQNILDKPLLPDLISFEQNVKQEAVEETNFPSTLLPISSEQDKFVSTISVTGKEDERPPEPESSHNSSTAPPYTTNINVNPPNQGNVSVIDIVQSNNNNKPIPSPTSPTPKPYSGSVVFHTYAGSSPTSISSASISLDGESSKIVTKMNGQEGGMGSYPKGAFAHSTIGVESNGDTEQVIQPMQAAKDQQGKVVCIVRVDDTVNNESRRTLKDTDVKDLVSVMALSRSNESRSESENDDSTDDACEEEIVPTKLTRDQEENVRNVLNLWKSTDSNEKTPDLFETAATQFMRNANVKFLTTEGVQSNAKSGEEEEMIQPMAVVKNQQGQSMLVPSSAKQPEKVVEKNVSNLIQVLREHNEMSHENKEQKDTNAKEVESHISEEDIVPTVLNKRETDILKSVFSQWGNSANDKPENRLSGSSFPENSEAHSTLGVSHTAKSGDEEDLIQPMKCVKDSRGNPLRLPSDYNVTSTSQPAKQWDETAIRDMSGFFSSNSPSVSNEQDSDGEEVNEEPVNVSVLPRNEKVIASDVLSKWGSHKDSEKVSEVVNDYKNVVPERQGLHTENSDSVDTKVSHDPESPTKTDTTDAPISPKQASQPDTTNKVLNAVNMFEKPQSSENVILRSKPRNTSDFKAKLAGFEKSSSTGASFDNTRSRPKSMVEFSSNRNSWSLSNSSVRDSGEKRLSFKPLSSLRSVGSILSHREDKSKAAPGNDRSSTGSSFSGSSFMTKAPKADHPKTRQEDGSPFQVDVLAGIVGLGFKAKVPSPGDPPQVTDVQRTGPLGRSNNVKVGDYLLSVNGTELTGQTDARVQQILRLLPRGLVKLVLATRPPSADQEIIDKTASGDCLDTSDPDQVPVTATVTSLNNGQLQLVTAGSKENLTSETDFPDNLSTHSSVSLESSPQAPVTARIEITPGKENGSPMKIAIKPTPTPRPSAGLPTIARHLHYASSTNESWDTSSEGSSPRDSGATKVRKISGIELIASQRKPGSADVDDKAILEQEENMSDSSNSTKQTSSSPDPILSPKPVEEELVRTNTDNMLNAAPKAASPKVPPPVAPKPRRTSSSSSSSSSVMKSDEFKNPEGSSQSVVPKSDDSKDKEDLAQSSSKGPKISAGYERLQAITKAKQSKPSKIIEKSRTFVSSKAKLFESDEEKKSELPNEKRTIAPGRPFNSSLVPMNERRKSTGSFPLNSSSLTRPKSLLPKGNLQKESSIPEQTSPNQESPDSKTTKSPTRINSALSPRRTSLSDSSSSVVFTFAPKQAPKLSNPRTSKTDTEGKVPTNSQSSPKDNVVFHKTTSPSLNKSLSPSLPASRLESRSENNSVFTPNRRSNSIASISPSKTPSLSTQLSEEKMEDTMKMFDDLLQDTPLPHSATDPSDILLWAPVRKDSPSSTVDDVKKREPVKLPESAEEKKRPVAPPRKAAPVSEEKGTAPVSIPVQEEMILPVSKAVDSHLPPAFLSSENNEKDSKVNAQDLRVKAPDYDTLLKSGVDRNSSENLLAAQLADEISREKSLKDVKCEKPSPELLLSSSLQNLNNGSENIPAGQIAEMIHEKSSKNENESDVEGQGVNESENIPATKIARELFGENENKEEYNYENLMNVDGGDKDSNIPEARLAEEMAKTEMNDSVNYKSLLVDTEGVDKESNIPAAGLATEIAKNELNDSVNEINDQEEKNSSDRLQDRYVAQANEIVQTVIAQISNQPEIFLREEKTESHPEPPSPSSSEDEPPPLPGAPPPPIIFRTNSVMLTEREWLDDMASDEKEAENRNAVVEEDMVQAVASNNDNQSMPVVSEEMHETKTDSEKEELSILIASSLANAELNIVGHNMAKDISRDLAGEDEELSHARSDSLEPLNSTGESSYQEGDGMQLHSPASVDVLSEDSGMQGDEEFQDDTISPEAEYRDSEVQKLNAQNVFTSKSPFLLNEISEPSHQNETSHPICVSDSINSNSAELPPSMSLSPLVPMLPSSPPPCVAAISDSSNELTYSSPTSNPVSHPQSSDFPPSSSEVSSPGDQVSQPLVVQDLPAQVEDEAVSKESVAVESEPEIHDTPKDIEPVIVNKPSTEESKPLQTIKENKVENDNIVGDGPTIKSSRLWSLISNMTKPSLVLEGKANVSVSVNFTQEALKTALSPEDFVSLVTKSNEVLDSLEVPSDTQLLVVHIHRGGDSESLGVDLKADAWYKVSSIKEASPLGKEGSVMVGDWVIAVDNLWFPQASLMRFLARLTKPKHNSLLVLARSQRSSQPSTVGLSKLNMETKKTSPRIAESKKEKVAPPSTKSKPSVPEKSEESPKADTGSEAAPGGEGGILDVSMMKGATGVGFCLEGGIGSPKGNVPIIIKRIFKGGPAEKCGQLKVKDEILSVNGVDFTKMRHYEAWNHLKFLDDGEVHFKIRRGD